MGNNASEDYILECAMDLVFNADKVLEESCGKFKEFAEKGWVEYFEEQSFALHKYTRATGLEIKNHYDYFKLAIKNAISNHLEDAGRYAEQGLPLYLYDCFDEIEIHFSHLGIETVNSMCFDDTNLSEEQRQLQKFYNAFSLKKDTLLDLAYKNASSDLKVPDLELIIKEGESKKEKTLNLLIGNYEQIKSSYFFNEGEKKILNLVQPFGIENIIKETDRKKAFEDKINNQISFYLKEARQLVLSHNFSFLADSFLFDFPIEINYKKNEPSFINSCLYIAEHCASLLGETVKGKDELLKFSCKVFALDCLRRAYRNVNISNSYLFKNYGEFIPGNLDVLSKFAEREASLDISKDVNLLNDILRFGCFMGNVFPIE